MDKEKKQLKEVQVKEMFSLMQEEKYKEWKEHLELSRDKYDEETQQLIQKGVDNRSNEQKSFETYLADQDIYKAPKYYIWRDLDDFSECVTKGTGCYRVGTQTYGKPSEVGGGKSPVNAGETGVVEIMFENTENSGREQVIQRFTSVASCRTFIRKWAKYGGDKEWTKWKEIGGSAKLPEGVKPLVFAVSYFDYDFNKFKTIATGNGQKIHIEQNVKVNKGDTVIIKTKKVTDRPDMTIMIFGIVTNTGSAGEITIDGKGYSTGIDTLSNGGGNAVSPQQPTTSKGDLFNMKTDKRSSVDNKASVKKYGVNIVDYRELKTLFMYMIDIKDKAILNRYSHKNFKQEDDEEQPVYEVIRGKGLKAGETINVKCDIITQGDNETELVFTSINNSKSKKATKYTKENNGVHSKTISVSDNSVYEIELGTKSDEVSQVKDKHKAIFKAYYGDIEPNRLDRGFVFPIYNGFELIGNKHIQDEYHTHKLGDIIKKKVEIVRLGDLNHYRKNNIVYFEMPSDFKDSDVSKIMTNNICEVDNHVGFKELKGQAFILKKVVKHENKVYLAVNCDWFDYEDILQNTELTYPINEKILYLKTGGFNITLDNGTILHSYNYEQIEEKNGLYIFTDIYGHKTKISVDKVISSNNND